MASGGSTSTAAFGIVFSLSRPVTRPLATATAESAFETTGSGSTGARVRKRCTASTYTERQAEANTREQVESGRAGQSEALAGRECEDLGPSSDRMDLFRFVSRCGMDGMEG